MRSLCTALSLSLAAMPAWAHPGHGAGEHAHPEWIIGGIGVLIAVGALWLWARR